MCVCVCASGLLEGGVSGVVDGGDDLQSGRLETLLQRPGGELLESFREPLTQTGLVIGRVLSGEYM